MGKPKSCRRWRGQSQHMAEGGNQGEHPGRSHRWLLHEGVIPGHELLRIHPWGRMSGAFSEQTMAACSYRGKLLGLLAIHLILLSINKIYPTLTGSVHIFSDCLGALNKAKNLPLHRIPSKCRHSNVLKMIMIHCSSMSFDCLFSHVSAHQDDREEFESLPREAQLNCTCDFGEKLVLLTHNPEDLPRQQQFPLEPISV